MQLNLMRVTETQDTHMGIIQNYAREQEEAKKEINNLKEQKIQIEAQLEKENKENKRIIQENKNFREKLKEQKEQLNECIELYQAIAEEKEKQKKEIEDIILGRTNLEQRLGEMEHKIETEATIAQQERETNNS